MHQPEDRDRATLQLVLAVDPPQPRQDVREHRVAARRRMVVEVLLPRDERLAVCRREEEAATLVVAEQLDREPREAMRLLEPAELAARDVQLVEPVRDARVVVEVAGALRFAAAPGPVQASVLARARPEPGLAEPPRRRDGAAALQP